MDSVIEKLEQVEELLKHQPGRHDQQTHAGKRSGAGGGDFVSQTKDHPDVKKYFEKGPSTRENSWAKMASFSSDLGRKNEQELTMYEGTSGEGEGKYKVRIFGGYSGSRSTWASTDRHDSVDSAIKDAMGQEGAGFLKTVEELPEYRKREPSKLWHGYD